MYHIDARHTPTITDHSPTILRPLAAPKDSHCLLILSYFLLYLYLHPTLRTSSDHVYCLLVIFIFPFIVTPPFQRPRNSSIPGPYPTSDLLYCLVPCPSTISVQPITSGTQYITRSQL